MLNQTSKFVPQPDDAKTVPIQRSFPAPSVIPVCGASSIQNNERDDAPRWANLLVGLIVLAVACGIALLAIRFERL